MSGHLQTQALPRWAEDILRAAPPAGQGVHNWLFRASLALRRCGRRDDEIRAVLEATTAGCGRVVGRKEMEDAIRKAASTVQQPDQQQGARKPASRWPAPNIEQLEAVVAERGGLVDLWEGSPVRLESAKPQTEVIVDQLFPGDPWLCCGAALDRMQTRLREAWRGQLAGLSFIVPSPMTAATGRNQDGKDSARCLDNTGPRRFLVVECDIAEFSRDGTKETPFTGLVRRLRDDQKTPADAAAAVLMHLAELAPLALAVHSGGKSVHGWFSCTGVSEQTLLTFMRRAVVLGADPLTWTRCQAVRMPDGLRDGKTRQGVFYFNPKVLR